jgi:bacillithiol synthase
VLQYVGGYDKNNVLLRRIIDPFRRAGRPMGEAFREAIVALLAPFNMAVADAADPALKRASVPVLRSALMDAERHEFVLTERGRELEAAGYEGPVTILERGTNVFRHSAGGRERLYRRGGDFGGRQKRPSLPRVDALAALEVDPGGFSPNVLLRPVVESYVFPTVAYVGGPGELGYFAQAGALFPELGMTPPICVPRFAGTVHDRAVERTLGTLGLGMEELLAGRDALRERIARQEIPEGAVSSLDRLRRDLVNGFEAMAEEAGQLDPTLGGTVAGIRNRALLSVARVEREMIRSLKRRESTRLRQLDRVLDSLRPGGSPQDRVLNVTPFLARYGSHFLDEVAAAVSSGVRYPS